MPFSDHSDPYLIQLRHRRNEAADQLEIRADRIRDLESELVQRKQAALSHVACEKHTESHVMEFSRCPYCDADDLRKRLDGAVEVEIPDDKIIMCYRNGDRMEIGTRKVFGIKPGETRRFLLVPVEVDCE